MRSYSRAAGAVVAAVVLGVTGCSSEVRPVPVRGVVTLDGQPVGGATVVFLPTGGTGRQASAYTDPQGRFALMTYRPKDGALPGEYKVVVHKTEGVEDPPEADPDNEKEVFEKFKKVEEKAHRPPRSSLPARYSDEDKSPLRCTVPARGDVALELRRDGAS